MYYGRTIHLYRLCVHLSLSKLDTSITCARHRHEYEITIMCPVLASYLCCASIILLNAPVSVKK